MRGQTNNHSLGKMLPIIQIYCPVEQTVLDKNTP